jgi:hypothetical protein
MSEKWLSHKSPGPGTVLEDLLVRMGHRRYPETIPVLASYWLKTVYAGGHDRRWWKKLSEALSEVLTQQSLNAASCEALVDIRTWIHQAILDGGEMPEHQAARKDPLRGNLTRERLVPYVSRLLNEWLAPEIAVLLTNESEFGSGIPVLAVGTALERLLLREHLSPETLQMLLEPELLSPRCLYPADVEMLTDVVLSLLGRTAAPVPPVLPAIVLSATAAWSLSPDYQDAVRHASWVQGPEGEGVHVPISETQAREILSGGPVRLASIIVTMDGRWWESESLQSGQDHSVVYKPGGRLRIDYSADHARLEAPWPDTQLSWRGPVHFQDFEVFGRVWRASSWETDGEHTRMHLMFSHVLPIERAQPAAELRRARPAYIDMAWAALEEALAVAVVEKSGEPIEQIRRADFIPLGRAIFRLAEVAKEHSRSDGDALETQLRAIQFLQAEISLEYGRVPWRILPSSTKALFLKKSTSPDVLGLLNRVFEGLPPALGERNRQGPSQAA